MHAAEHQRQVVLLRIRGIAFEAIGKQLGITKQGAHKLYQQALHLTPKADIEELFNLGDARHRIDSIDIFLRNRIHQVRGRQHRENRCGGTQLPSRPRDRTSTAWDGGSNGGTRRFNRGSAERPRGKIGLRAIPASRRILSKLLSQTDPSVVRNVHFTAPFGRTIVAAVSRLLASSIAGGSYRQDRGQSFDYRPNASQIGLSYK
jgi:hypothetical protein